MSDINKSPFQSFIVLYMLPIGYKGYGVCWYSSVASAKSALVPPEAVRNKLSTTIRSHDPPLPLCSPLELLCLISWPTNTWDLCCSLSLPAPATSPPVAIASLAGGRHPVPLALSCVSSDEGMVSFIYFFLTILIPLLNVLEVGGINVLVFLSFFLSFFLSLIT